MFKGELYDPALADEISKIPEEAGEATKYPGIRQAFTELYEILKHCNHEVRSSVPEKFFYS